MAHPAVTASFVGQVEELRTRLKGSDEDVDQIITDLLLGAQAVDHIKKRAVMLLDQDKPGTYWHDREAKDLLRLAEFTYRRDGWHRLSQS